jgi:hypothetical protein
MKMRNSGIVMEVTRQMTIATRQEEQEWMTLSKKYQRERETSPVQQQQIDRAALLPSVPPPRIIHMIITRIRVREAYCCATKSHNLLLVGPALNYQNTLFFFSPPPLSHLSKYYNNPKCTEIKTSA